MILKKDENKIAYENDYMFCRDELKECDKHEIIVNISNIIGNSPRNLCKAEEIFNKIKYDIAKFIINYEYGKNDVLNDPLSIWLEEKSCPNGIEKLTRIIEQYLK